MLAEYDLYNMVHKNPKLTPRRNRNISPNSHALSSKKTVLLTAKSLDSHFTNGKNDWCLVDCGCDMYRTLVKSSGTETREVRSRLETGELVFFDFQPLSTRLSLMTKFIVIAQGGTVIPSSYITVYDALSPNSITSRSKSFDSSLLNHQRGCETNSGPRKGIVMPNSGLYVKIWSKDDIKVSIFGTDPCTRMNKASYDSCKLVPARNMRPVRSSKISELMSNFEPQINRPIIKETKTILTENSISESSLTNAANQYLVTSNVTNSNKTILTKSYSENNPRVLTMGVRSSTTTTSTTHDHDKNQTFDSNQQTVNNNNNFNLPQRISIPIQFEDPSLAVNLLSDGSARSPKTEVITYSYRRQVDPNMSNIKGSRGSSSDAGKIGSKKREQVRFDDSWEKIEQNSSQKKLLRSSEWALAKQQTKKEF